MTAATNDACVILALPAELADDGFVLRPETAADIPFLRRLYLLSRWEELAPLADWTDVQKRSFLESQFALQRQHYRTHFADTDFTVLERRGAPIGRLYIDRRDDTLIVHDIALLPEWRGGGVGTALMQAVCNEARSAGKKVSVAVEKYNPAQRLYRRLGFRETSNEGVHWIMEWSATADVAPGSRLS